jgi:hypothetical protein
MSNGFAIDTSMGLQHKIAKPILDQVANQMRIILDKHTDKSFLSANEQNDMLHLQSLYITIAQQYIGEEYFLTPSNFPR